MVGSDERGLTERQRNWLASVRASLEAETGRSLEDWAEIARACPETRPRARLAWLKAHHGLGQNRAALVLEAAFPPDPERESPEALRAALWSDPAARRIFEALELAAAALPEFVVGQRKGYTAFSRRLQFAAARPMKGGSLVLGLAVDPDADPALEPPRNEGWSERLRSRRLLTSADQVDRALIALLKAAWERS
jgi:hypothetical protein